MSTQHPITSPDELVTSLRDSAPYGLWETNAPRERWLINHAYAAGADMEPEACIEWLVLNGYGEAASRLRIARRPKPPSLKEQALHELADVYDRDRIDDSTYDTIRRALEALND